MKTTNIYRLAGALLLAGIMLTGCTKDNTLTEIVKPEEQKETVDEFAEVLKAIDGVRNVEVKTNSGGDETLYYFTFRQLIDHSNPDAGTFDQRVSIRFKGYDKDVVLYTHGYEMSDIERYIPSGLATLLGANQVNVEHRYFGGSLPEPADKMKYTYFNAEQQAHDLHAIVQALKQNLFKNNKWGSTGTSKDGMTSGLYAYYSDLNGWNDIDLFVPFCAPFLPGITTNGQFSCMDTRTGNYQDLVCGTGYEPGSVEAIACQRLHDIPKYICTNKVLRDACAKYMLMSNPEVYRKIVDQYNQHSPMSTGSLEKDVAALSCYTFSNYLFVKFSYVQFPLWAKLVPDPAKAVTDSEELDHLLTFITMDQKALIDSLKAMNAQQEAQEETTRSVLTGAYDRFWNYIKELRSEPSTPYYVQAFTELGTAGDSFKHVDGTFLTEEQVRNVCYIFSVQYRFDGLFQQDKGKLMRNFREWVGTESTQNIVFVYAYNDPWTGGRPDDEAVRQNPKTAMVIDPIAVHNDYFFSSDYYTVETKNAIVDAVNKCMK